MIDLSGFWGGTYAYSGGKEPVSFDAELSQSGSTLSGHMTEPNSFVPGVGPLLPATVSGHIDGRSVTFTKTYQVRGAAEHTVIYEGEADKDGTHISGYWTLSGLKGTFEMRRDQGKLLDPLALQTEDDIPAS